MPLPSKQSQSKGHKCEDERCNTPESQVSYCVDCDTSYCDECWRLQAPHKPGKVGRDGIEHEKANYQVLQVYKNILHPPSEVEKLRQMHEDDSDTLWFGVTKDETGDTRLEDHGRYAALMADSPSASVLSTTKYPQLVSFVGVTNAGKSTIIKMLIDRQGWNQSYAEQGLSYPSPVVGSATNDKVPTSGDVHLYADPSTFDAEFPMLYADCEGMEGGEALPYGSQSRKRAGSTSDKHRRKRPPKMLEGRSRRIAWAQDEKTKKREYAVTELYPRLLYTFSDVIVFVLRNAKTFQSSVLGKLLEWGAASLEKSLNQPTLPHAVIVLNATDLGINEEEWDPNVATRRLLSTVQDGLDKFSGVPELRALADQWRHVRGVEIRSVEDLILKYYSSFTVVRIPVKGRYTLMDRQAQRLHDTIESRCKESHESKRRARMVLNSEDLNIYLQAAFDHFTKDLDKPFNFIEVSLKNNPLPETFADHIVQLALALKYHCKNSQGLTGHYVFDFVGRIVASCLLVDSVRYRKGTTEDLFQAYRPLLEDALYEFCEMHWPCSYKNRKGQQCALVSARHKTKGHQNENGRIIGSGDYESPFSADAYVDEWVRSVRDDLLDLQNDLQKREADGRNRQVLDHALELHRDRLWQTFQPIDRMRPEGRLISHATCFCCLREIPEHGLPCGHVLCTNCAEAYSRKEDDTVRIIEFCPMHGIEPFPEPWRLHFKPKYAGVRVLGLDGGGVRGVVELHALLAIEKTIGCDLPIQAFFDLIVGTSTGGIIALALGVKQWSVGECLKKFVGLCDDAFQKRPLGGIPGMGQLSLLSHGSMYKTTPLHNALADALGDSMLFGGVKDQSPEYPIKVAVTATEGTGRAAQIISNYSRPQTGTEGYDLVRFDHPDLEFQLHEAAAATSAAPGYFKPFYHQRTKRTFLDGALYHNNPIHVANTERKLLWPDVKDSHPDILLSIGTGTNSQIREDTAEHPGHIDRDVGTWKFHREQMELQDKDSERPGRILIYKQIKALFKRFDNILDAELAWKGFKADVPGNLWPRTDTLPYVRLNPDLGRPPPPLDATDQVLNLQERVMQRLLTQPLRNETQRIAFQLVASTFYFVKRGSLVTSEDSTAQIYRGKICCRFANGSRNLRKLGNFLRLQQNPQFTPYFSIQEHGYTEVKEIPITPSVIEAMINNAVFDLHESSLEIEVWNPVAATNITLNLRASATLETNDYSISGFPRWLGVEDSNKDVKRVASPEPSSFRSKRRLNRSKRVSRNHLTPVSSHEDQFTKHEDDTIEAHSREASLAEAATQSMYTWRKPSYEPSSSSSRSNTDLPSSSRNTSLFELEGDVVLTPDDRSFEYDTEKKFEADTQRAIDDSLAFQPRVQRTNTMDSEMEMVIERSKRHLVK